VTVKIVIINAQVMLTYFLEGARHAGTWSDSLCSCHSIGHLLFTNTVYTEDKFSFSRICE